MLSETAENAIGSDVLTELYTVMVRGRALEQGLIDSLQQGLIPGFIHSAIGQEAAAAGVCVPLRKDDYVYTNHRGHIHAVAKGAAMGRIVAEVFGRIDGLCKGKAGSIHLTDVGVGLLGGSGIVAGGIPIATGAALGCKLRKTDQVVVCFFGNGAADNGYFHESLNMASLWSLPIIYCCENNGWAEFTPQNAVTRVLEISSRADAYGIKGVLLSGSDVVAIYQAAKEAIARARNGEGPTLIECKTSRWFGHYVGDTQPYRSQDEVQEARTHDAIAILEARLLENKVLTPDEVQGIRDRVQSEVASAIRFAEGSPLPDISEIHTDVYCD